MFSVSSFTEYRLPISAASVTEASFYSAVLIPFLITAPVTAEAMPANAKIQSQLGKDDMQFHSQDEFDGLMSSDDDFKL